MVKQGSVEVGPPAEKGEGRARRAFVCPDTLTATPKDAPEVTILADIVQRSVRLYGDLPALGWRDTIRMVEEEKEVTKVVGGQKTTETRSWSYFELSDYKYMSYKELGELVKDVGSALVETGHSKDTIFNVYASTAPKWQAVANACASQSITFATAYDSLGEEGLEHSINEPSAYGMFTNANLLGTVAAIAGKTPSLQVLVWDGPAEAVPAGALDKIKAAREGIRIFTFDEFVQLGKDNPKEPNHPKPEDTACLMYTSGSTGAPKGVIITNANIIAAVAAVQALLPHVIQTGETYIAYLPLAHIMEFAVEMCMMFVGSQMGYGTVKTLTDASVRNCVGDIRALRPTIMVGVPAVWELIRKGILTKVNAAGGLKAAVFHGALAAKKFGGKGSIIAGVMDTIVFNAVKQGTGGRLKWALSGGAQISRETQEFLSVALVTILQGYGMTESTAMCCLLPPEFHDYATVGVPVPSVEIKLVDVEEAGYFSTNSPPQGEVLIRGPSVTKGYYKREDITKETFTEDGWLRTGDIGQWNKNGTLSIIDRKKNLVKLAGGEYIALERLESVYKSCSFISNICIYADSQANKAMAIIFPHEGNLKSLASLAPESHGDLALLCKNQAVRDAVLKELNLVGKKAGLKPLETMQTVVLTPEEWTPQNGLMTAAQKLQRKAIEKKYKPEIDAVYP
ncbi:hypothetical protein RQP46_008858 [Phenoliferia psychrophenolica]